MPQTIYKVQLSVIGEHSVSVSSDDPAAVTEALVWAKQTHGKLARLSRGPVPQETAVSSDGHHDDGDAEEAPICAVHQLPMVRVQGRRGPFWSCHERNPDGSFCSYKPAGQ